MKYNHDYVPGTGVRLVPVHFEFNQPLAIRVCVGETFEERPMEARILHPARNGRCLKNRYLIYWPEKPCPTHLARETRSWR